MTRTTRAITDDTAADLELIRRALVHERDEKGSALRDLSEQIGMSPQALLDIINGDTKPYPKSMAKLRRWARGRAADGTLEVKRPPTGVAFRLFRICGSRRSTATLLRSAELEALRHFSGNATRSIRPLLPSLLRSAPTQPR